MDMVAMIWANQIMKGKAEYKNVPSKLKTKVKNILIDCGCEDLVVE